jgi:hypothetical protein
MEILTLINGNNQKYTVQLPKISILTDYINDTALQHVFEETGLRFTKIYLHSYEAQPENSQQIVKLFLTWNLKTQYHNNAINHNTLFLKFDHHIGFEVDSICYECVKENHIVTNGLKEGDRLAC